MSTYLSPFMCQNSFLSSGREGDYRPASGWFGAQQLWWGNFGCLLDCQGLFWILSPELQDLSPLTCFSSSCSFQNWRWNVMFAIISIKCVCKIFTVREGRKGQAVSGKSQHTPFGLSSVLREQYNEQGLTTTMVYRKTLPDTVPETGNPVLFFCCCSLPSPILSRAMPA